MTRTEAEALVDRIAASFRGRIHGPVRDTWADALADLDHAAATAAVDHLTRTEERMPSIAQVREATRTANGGNGNHGPLWHVLTQWRDANGAPWAGESWHHTEHEARRAYLEAQSGRTLFTRRVELLRHHQGNGIVETVETTTVTRTDIEPGA